MHALIVWGTVFGILIIIEFGAWYWVDNFYYPNDNKPRFKKRKK